MKAVFKYKIDLYTNELVLHEDAMPLNAHYQNGELFLWVLVDTTKPLIASTTRTFLVCGTGESLPDLKDTWIDHINTVHSNTGLVFHVFEERSYDE